MLGLAAIAGAGGFLSQKKGRKKARRGFRKIRNKLGLTSKNALGKSLVKLRSLFTGGNSASNLASSGVVPQSTWHFQPKSISEMM